METFIIPNEADFKRWMKEAIAEYFSQSTPIKKDMELFDEPLLPRDEVIKMFGICHSTLRSWAKNGLPNYRDKRRVFFLRSDILEYLKKQHKSPSF